MLYIHNLLLLRKTVNTLFKDCEDLSTIEFEKLLRKDEVFRKNIQLWIKDVTLVIEKLNDDMQDTENPISSQNT